MSKNILVTGGAGYIGSHTSLQLLIGGYNVTVIDNLDNASDISLQRVKELAGEFGSKLTFHKVDLRDKAAIGKLFSSTKFDAVIHFAGLKAVGESVQKPLLYYNKNNIIGTVNMMEVMSSHGCKMIHSFLRISHNIYVWQRFIHMAQIHMDEPSSSLKRYAVISSALMLDGKLFCCGTSLQLVPIPVAILVRIHEESQTILCHMCSKLQCTCGTHLTVYGTDYKTKDGTGVRDNILVVDLADGHIAALKKLFAANIGCEVYNLGTGKGTTVLEMVAAFEKASRKVPQQR